VAQHNVLNRASGYTFGGLFGLSGYNEASKLSVEKARMWLDRIGLTARADHPAGDLPYGAQRRLEIARAMCTDPELLCLDEPAAGLNPRESLELNTLLKAIRNETGTSILLIEHDMSVVMGISDHVVVLEYGTKISDGNPDHVKNDPKVIAAYLGVDEDEAEALTAKSMVKPAVIAEKAIMSDAAPVMAAATVPAVPARAAKVAAKVKAKVPVVTKPKAKATVAAKTKDDLKLIKGIGPVNEQKLNRHGVRTFAQIAGWKKADIVEAERYLEFDGRIAREDWVSQARMLARETAKAATSKGRT
jgi:branched-chain amino acid transport system ATP-binding protein